VNQGSNTEDRAAIHDVLMRYFRGADRTDADLIRDCFHPDAEIDFGEFFKGDLPAFVEYLPGPTGWGAFARTLHVTGNELIEVDGTTARAETYCVAYHEPPAEPGEAPPIMIVWLRYLDRFERRQGEWRILRRRTAVEWVRQDDAGGWQELPGEMRGVRGPDDPVFEI